MDLSTDGPIEAEAGAVVEIPVRLMAQESRLESRSTLVMLVLIADDYDRLSGREEARFLGPRRAGGSHHLCRRPLSKT